MTRDDIIQLANEALVCQQIWIDESDSMALESVILFAKLVAADKAKELAEELRKMPLNDTANSIAIWIENEML